MTVEQIHHDAEQRMQKAIHATQHDLAAIRTGRANPQILDRLVVDYYGTPTPVRQMSNVSAPDGHTLLIQPYDRSNLGDIEKAIAKSDLGLTPNNDGSVIRLSIPPLTEERRKEMVKLIKKYAEEGKVAIRNIRRDAADGIKKLEKELHLPEDEVKRRQDDIQKLTDRYIGQLEKIGADKEQEVLSI
jgi:ribosome recycling factor